MRRGREGSTRPTRVARLLPASLPASCSFVQLRAAMTARYAIYYAPPASTPLWSFGSAVLGYDAEQGAEVAFPEGTPFRNSEWAAATEEPRRYGFHATLKAPFSLKPGLREGELLSAARHFAQGCHPFTVQHIEVRLLGRFVALVPPEPEPLLDHLAAQCVRAFDGFREPLSAEDRARRLASPLSDRQVRYLDVWGYPHVFDEFRFHMTLTGALPPERREPIRAWLAARHAELHPGALVDSIAVFRQDSREARFRILERLAFAA